MLGDLEEIGLKFAEMRECDEFDAMFFIFPASIYIGISWPSVLCDKVKVKVHQKFKSQPGSPSAPHKLFFTYFKTKNILFAKSRTHP